MKTLAYFGFAANPPHLGHLKAIEWLATKVDTVIVSPSAAHAFGKKMQSYETRLRWANLLLENTQSNIIVSDLEEKIAFTKGENAVVYSYDVLNYLKSLEDLKNYKIMLAIGPDNAEPNVWSKFYNFEKIDLEFGKIVIPEMKDVVRSTYIRNLYKDGQKPDFELLRKLTGDAVAKDLVKNFGDLKW